MLPDVTYDDYTRLGGKVSAEEFPTLLVHAKAAVREIIGFNVPRNEREQAAYIAAVCAAVDVDKQHGGSGGVGESGNGYTIGSYTTNRGSSDRILRTGYDEDMARVIKPHLIGTSLLYQVIM